jgi:hypothetical protein
MRLLTMNHLTLLMTCLTLFVAAQASDPLQFTSTEQQTLLIELYSSEGCHSCPPADQFISQFSQSDELWERYIPLVFHVDYWDYLGWQDPYASPAFSNRQRQHSRQGNLSSVYTPGFVVNGEEWRGFFQAWRVLPEVTQQPGRLKLNISNHQAQVYYAAAKGRSLTHHLAVLGSGLASSVSAGENTGKRLTHDFVVLDHQQISGTSGSHFQLPLLHQHQPERLALVAWVTEAGSLRPLQAVGGWLPDGAIRVL